jgi:hypothetical protein
VWIGGLGATAVVVPVAISIAPPAIAGLGAFGASIAITALGVGVIGLATYVGKEIDDFREVGDSHIKIKKILDGGESDVKKIESIKRIATVKTENMFSKLFKKDGTSEEIGYMYSGFR